MSLNIREMLLGDPLRLAYVSRWGTTRVLRRESVAEHSYYVVLYTTCICCWLRERSLIRLGDMNEAMMKATVHDLEEARSGDFPRSFKYSSPELKDLVEKTSTIAARQLFENLDSDDSPTNPMPAGYSMSSILTDSWKNSKDSTLSGRIVQFADFLSVLSYVCDEVRSGNSRSLKENIHTMRSYFSTFMLEEFDFIRPLVEQATKVLKEEFENG